MSELNIDDLLDSTLDDLEDLPEFKPFPPGIHKVLVSLALKEVNGKTQVENTMKLMETLELANASDEAPKEGDVSSVLYDLTNEFGQGNFKKLAPIREALGVSTNRELIEQAQNVECLIVTSIRKDKTDPDRKYLNLKELQVV